MYGGQSNRLLVFVPEYHIRGSIWLSDAKGLPLPPAADVEAEAAGSGDAYALAARRTLRLETGALFEGSLHATMSVPLCMP